VKDIAPPIGLLAELTHRCPLQCAYCSNPVNLDRKSAELTTEEWKRVFTEANGLGVLQLHLSGGEPTARHDLEDIVAHCAKLGAIAAAEVISHVGPRPLVELRTLLP